MYWSNNSELAGSTPGLVNKVKNIKNKDPLHWDESDYLSHVWVTVDGPIASKPQRVDSFSSIDSELVEVAAMESSLIFSKLSLDKESRRPKATHNTKEVPQTATSCEQKGTPTTAHNSVYVNKEALGNWKKLSKKIQHQIKDRITHSDAKVINKKPLHPWRKSLKKNHTSNSNVQRGPQSGQSLTLVIKHSTCNTWLQIFKFILHLYFTIFSSYVILYLIPDQIRIAGQPSITASTTTPCGKQPIPDGPVQYVFSIFGNT